MDNYYDDQQSNYSDDFEEDETDVRVNAKPPPPPVQSTPKRTTFKEKTSITDPLTSRKAKSHYSTTKRMSLKGKGKDRALSETKASKTANYSFMSSPRNRELSAKQHALRKAENDLSATKRELDELKKENRLLNRLQVRQEKQLDKIQTQEGELPQILARHAEEVRVLKEQVKRCQEISQSYQHKVNDLRQEMLRINDRKKKLEEIARRRQLLERETLSVQLQQTQATLREKETKITELERGMEAMGKNHHQEVRLLRQKNKALAHENEDLRNTTQRLHSQFKDKEKEVEVLNIYSQRIGKNLPRNVTRLQAPITENISSQTDLSCPPNKLVSLQSKPPLKSSSSQTDIPQDKPHPLPNRRDSKICSTQTDIVVNPKNETLLVTLSPEAFQATDSEPTQQHVSVPETSQTAKKEMTKSSTDEDQQQQRNKELLLSKLKAMDGQKGPPASQPVPSTVTKSSVEHTAVASVNSERANISPAPAPAETVRSQAPTQIVSTVTQSTQSQVENDREAQRKKLLMAKLMAIDEGDNPNNVTLSSVDVSKNTSGKSAIKKSSANQSKSSLQSWPDTIENMYHGKPAHATEDDPFGSRHTSGKKPLYKKESGLLNKEPSQPQIHKPSFGRRAGPAASTKPRNGMIFGGLEDTETVHKPKQPSNPFTFEVNNTREYPWETRMDISSQASTARERASIGGGQSLLFGHSANPDSLLPLRPKAETSLFVAEPDDLEELAL